MKNFFKLFGVIALVVVIGFSFVACDNGTTDGDGGTWSTLRGTEWVIANQKRIKFSDGGGPAMITYTWSDSVWSQTSGGQITIQGDKILYSDGSDSFNFAISGTTMTVSNATNTHLNLNGTYTKQ